MACRQNGQCSMCVTASELPGESGESVKATQCGPRLVQISTSGTSPVYTKPCDSVGTMAPSIAISNASHTANVRRSGAKRGLKRMGSESGESCQQAVFRPLSTDQCRPICVMSHAAKPSRAFKPRLAALGIKAFMGSSSGGAWASCLAQVVFMQTAIFSIANNVRHTPGEMRQQRPRKRTECNSHNARTK